MVLFENGTCSICSESAMNELGTRFSFMVFGMVAAGGNSVDP